MFSDDELKNIANILQSKGRNGDKILAHIMPEEAELLDDMGGSGTVNPETGLLEFFSAGDVGNNSGRGGSDNGGGSGGVGNDGGDNGGSANASPDTGFGEGMSAEDAVGAAMGAMGMSPDTGYGGKSMSATQATNDVAAALGITSNPTEGHPAMDMTVGSPMAAPPSHTPDVDMTHHNEDTGFANGIANALGMPSFSDDPSEVGMISEASRTSPANSKSPDQSDVFDAFSTAFGLLSPVPGLNPATMKSFVSWAGPALTETIEDTFGVTAGPVSEGFAEGNTQGGDRVPKTQAEYVSDSDLGGGDKANDNKKDETEKDGNYVVDAYFGDDESDEDAGSNDGSKYGSMSFYDTLSGKGRFGDSMVAHLSPDQAGILKAAGGAGTTNPETGLPEFYNMNYGQMVGGHYHQTHAQKMAQARAKRKSHQNRSSSGSSSNRSRSRSSGGRDYGKNASLNRKLAKATGYDGNFGNGRFTSWYNNNASSGQQRDAYSIIDSSPKTNASNWKNPTGGGSSGGGKYGNNSTLNRRLVDATGYDGGFGGGQFNDWYHNEAPFDAQKDAYRLIDNSPKVNASNWQRPQRRSIWEQSEQEKQPSPWDLYEEYRLDEGVFKDLAKQEGYSGDWDNPSLNDWGGWSDFQEKINPENYSTDNERMRRLDLENFQDQMNYMLSDEIAQVAPELGWSVPENNENWYNDFAQYLSPDNPSGNKRLNRFANELGYSGKPAGSGVDFFDWMAQQGVDGLLSDEEQSANPLDQLDSATEATTTGEVQPNEYLASSLGLRPRINPMTGEIEWVQVNSMPNQNQSRGNPGGFWRDDRRNFANTIMV